MIRYITTADAERDPTPCRFCGRPFKEHMDPPTQLIDDTNCLGSRCNFKPVVTEVADAWDAGYQAGILAQSQKERGRAKFKIYNPHRRRS